MGLHAAQLRQQHEMMLAHLQMAQQAMQQHIAFQNQQIQLHQQAIDNTQAYRVNRENRLSGAAADKQQQEYGTQQGNADTMAQTTYGPQAGADYMQSGHDPEDFFNAAQGALDQRNQFAQMPSAAQRPVVTSTLESQRALTKQSQLEDIKRRVGDARRGQQHGSIEASNLPDDVKAKLHMRVDGVPVPMNSQAPLSMNEWQSLPVRQTMDPTMQATADQWVATTGKFPPEYMLKPPTTHMNPAHDPGILAAHAGVAQAQDQWKTTYAQHQAAMHELNGYMAQNRSDLADPDSPAGKKAVQGLEERRNAMKAATDQLTGAAKLLDIAHQKHIGSLQTYGQQGQPGAAPGAPRSAAPAPAAPLSDAEAAAQVASQHPDWDPANPAHRIMFNSELAKLKGGAAAAPKAGGAAPPVPANSLEEPTRAEPEEDSEDSEDQDDARDDPANEPVEEEEFAIP